MAQSPENQPRIDELFLRWDPQALPGAATSPTGNCPPGSLRRLEDYCAFLEQLMPFPDDPVPRSHPTRPFELD